MHSKNFFDPNLFKNDYRNIILRNIYKLFLEKKIKYICLNNPYYLSSNSGDIDLLISEKDVSKAYFLIRSFLKKNNLLNLERKDISINKIYSWL